MRGFYSSLKQDPTTAANLGLSPADLPGRGFGGEADLHLLLLRGRTRALGVVGQAILTSARAQQKDDTGAPIGDPVGQQLRGVSVGVSLNFGHRDGWSYLSAAMGPLFFTTFIGQKPPAETPPRQMTLNLGGGARWFASKHLGFCFDMRFYQTPPQAATTAYPSRQRTQLLIMSGGVTVR